MPASNQRIRFADYRARVIAWVRGYTKGTDSDQDWKRVFFRGELYEVNLNDLTIPTTSMLALEVGYSIWEVGTTTIQMLTGHFFVV